VLTYWLYTKLLKSKVKDGHNKNMDVKAYECVYNHFFGSFMNVYCKENHKFWNFENESIYIEHMFDMLDMLWIVNLHVHKNMDVYIFWDIINFT